ncbi:MAG: hypothetical protein DMF54_10585 [Acidobacteria bacterium]|nr:MAG: hypothetical protein DMF54_10585 [Acidobacteriota bacterium]
MQALTASVALQVFNAVTGIVLARGLMPGERGTLAAAILWPGLLSSLIAFGVADAIACRSSAHPDERASLLSTGIVMSLALSLVATPIGLVLLPRLLSHYGSDAVESSKLFLLYIPLYLTWQNMAAVLLGALHTVEFNVARILQVGLAAAGIVALALGHLGSVRGFVIVYLVANAGTLGYVVWRAMRLRLEIRRPSGRIGWAVLSYGARSHLGTVSGITNEYLDQAVISVVLPASQLAYYAIATSVLTPMVLLGTSLGMMAMPSLASQPDESIRARNVARYTRVTLALEVGLALAIFAVIPILIVALFGHPYEPAVIPAHILVFAAVFLGTNRLLSAGLRASNRPLTAGTADLIASVATVAGLVVLIPKMGIAGAAVTSLCAYGVATVFYSVALRRLLGASYAALLVARPSDFRFILRRMLGH